MQVCDLRFVLCHRDTQWRRLGLTLALALCAGRPYLYAQQPCRPLATRHSHTVTLVAVGDILLDRGVGKEIARYGIGYPFKHVAPVLSAADIAFGNLECPFSETGVKTIKPHCFQVQPRLAQCLVLGGFDILSLANNHTMDCGRTGLVETMERLTLKGMRYCGAGNNREAARGGAQG